MIRLTVPPVGAPEITAIVKVLRSGYLTQGKKVETFEKIVADYVGTKYAVAVSSGTAALHLALLVLGIGPGDEVIVPDFTYPATANVIELAGAKPVFVDITLGTYNIDTAKIEEKITKRTKAIMPVHLFGQSASMAPLFKIAKEYRLYVIEDAACALGAKYRGRPCGALGDVGCFSFHPRKVICTGEGGMVTTDEKTFAKKIKILRNHGIKHKGRAVDFVVPGFNYRMTELAAAMGIEQIKKIDFIVKTRQKMASRYHRLLKDSALKLPVVLKENISTFQSYVVRAPDEIYRNRLMAYLKSKGVETTIGTYAVHNTQFYKKKYSLKKSRYPRAQDAYQNSLSLPIYPGLKNKDVRYIASLIKNFR